MEEDESSSVDVEEPSALSCKECGKGPYGRRWELRQHMRCHVYSPQDYSCSQCHVGFELERQLQAHFGSPEHQRRGKRARENVPVEQQYEAVGFDDLSLWEQSVVDQRLAEPPAVASVVSTVSPQLVDIDTIMSGLGVRSHDALLTFGKAVENNRFSAFQSRFPTLKEQRKVAEAVEDGVLIPTMEQLSGMWKTSAKLVESVPLGPADLFVHLVPPPIIYSRWLAYGTPIQTPVLEKTANGERIYSSYVSADHFAQLCSRVRLQASQLLLVVFLYADATVLVKQGTRNAHPIYMVYANPPASVPTAERLLLVGYLPVVSSEYMLTHRIMSSSARATFRADVYQKSIELVTRLMGVTTDTHNGMHVTPLGKSQPLNIVPILGAFLGDRLELMTAVGMYSSQNAVKMQHPCRTCNITGPELMQIDCQHHPVGRPDDFDVIDQCYTVLTERQQGMITDAREILKAHSRQAVMPALRKCHFFRLETMTPRCTLHTTKIVMANYFLTWTLNSFMEQDPTANWVTLVNQNAARIDPALGCIYKKVQGTGWSINPQIMTGQHRQRALDVLIFAVRGVAVADYRNDLTVRALARWRYLQAIVTLKSFTDTNLRQVDASIRAVKTLSLAAYNGQTNFSFPTGHELTHLALDRMQYGNFSVTNTEQGEKGHKTMVKDYWSETSRQKTERTMVNALELYVHGHLVQPLRLGQQTTSTASKADGPVGDGRVVQLGDIIQEYASHKDTAVSSMPWQRLSEAWATVCSDEVAQTAPDSVLDDTILIHHQYRLRTGEKVKATTRFHRQTHLTDVVKLADGSVYRVVLIFQAISRSLHASGRQEAYMWAERMEPLPHCTIYLLELVAGTHSYMIIRPSDIAKRYDSRWAPGGSNRHEYYLLGTDMDHNIHAAE